MTNPFADIYEDPPEKKKKPAGGSPFDDIYEEASPAEEEARFLGFVRGQGREGVLGTAEDFGRGVLATAVTGLPGLVEAGAGLASKLPVVGKPASQAKEFLKRYREEAMAEIDPQGIAGGVGQLAGIALPGGVGGAYGKLYSKSGKLIESLPKVGPVAAKIAAKAAAKTTGTAGQKLAGLAAKAPARAATSAIRGAPINVGIAVGMSDDPEQRNKEIAIGIVGDLVFGTLDRGIYAAPKAKGEPGKPITAESLPADAVEPTVSADRLKQLAEIKAEGLKKKAAKEATARAQRLARSKWQIDNPDLVWNKLSAEDKKAAYSKYIEPVPEAEAHPDPVVDANAEIAAAASTPAVEAKIAETLEVKPDATPEELHAAVAEMPEIVAAKEATEQLAKDVQAKLEREADAIKKPETKGGPTIEKVDTSDTGGNEMRHQIIFDTIHGPVQAIVYVTKDGKSARVDWLGHMEKPQVDLGISNTKAILKLLKGQFPEVEQVAYDRAGGTHKLMEEADRQKAKTLEGAPPEALVSGEGGAPALRVERGGAGEYHGAPLESVVGKENVPAVLDWWNSLNPVQRGQAFEQAGLDPVDTTKDLVNSPDIDKIGLAWHTLNTGQIPKEGDLRLVGDTPRTALDAQPEVLSGQAPTSDTGLDTSVEKPKRGRPKGITNKSKADAKAAAAAESKARARAAGEDIAEQQVIGGPEPVGVTQTDADAMLRVLETLESRGMDGSLMGDVAENVRLALKQDVSFAQKMQLLDDIIEDFTPPEYFNLVDEGVDPELALRPQPEAAEPVALSPEEEAALIAETQEAGLIPEPDATTTPEAPLQNPTEEPLGTPQPDATQGVEAPLSPVSIRLELVDADISTLSEAKLNKVEQKILEIIADEGKPQALRDAAERDLNRLFDFQRQKNIEAGLVVRGIEQAMPQGPGIPMRPELPTQTVGAEIIPPAPKPERAAAKPPKIQVVGETETFLTSQETPKPLEQMTTKQREKLTDTLRAKIAKLDPLNDREKIDELENDLALIKDVSEGRVPGGRLTKLQMEQQAARAEAATLKEAIGEGEDIPDEVFVKLARANVRRMDATDLKDLARALTDRIKYEADPDAVKAYQDKLHKVMEEVAVRSKDMDGPAVARIPPGVGGGALGFAIGYYSTDDPDERVTNGFMWAAVGAGSGALAGRILKRGGAPKIDRTPQELPGGDWQAEVGQHVITGRVKDGRPVSFMENMRDIYFQIVRRSYIGERFMSSIDAEGLRTVRNPAKLMEMFGRWTAQTESALRNGPSLYDEFGNERHLEAPGVHEILDDIEGDVETLGTLMAVRTVIEHGGTIKVPFDLVQAVNAYHRIPEKFHQAADKARKLSLAMANVLTDSGILARDKLAVFESEQWYAALERVFKFSPDMGGPAAEKGKQLSVSQVNPLKHRKKGSKDAIKNPFETLVESIPRFYRAAELNKIKSSFVDAWEAAGKPEEWMQLISGKDAGDYDFHLKKVDEIRAEIKGLNVDGAHALVAAFDPSSINIDKGTMRIYRNGQIQNYKIHGDLARALLSLNPDEMHMAVRMLGAPARLASTGVVMNPFFVAKMGFFDMFQATINSQYGFRPGIDNIRGWWNIVSRSPKYQKLLAVGLSHQSLAGANVENIKTTYDALMQTRGTPIEVAVRHLKEARPIEFYKALVAPIADAARVGEALRALDHGASHLDAVYAAKTVTGNYQERGAWAGMRGLQHMTMFLGPALQVLDTAAHRGGLHPFRAPPQGSGLKNRGVAAAAYGFKSFVMIGLPSMYFWAAAQGDEEIKELRTAEAGRKWWFMRLPWDVNGYGTKGDIIRIPKPILDGQLMGTSVEIALDMMNDQNPVEAGEFAKSVMKDAMFNLAPTVGVIPYSLQAGQDLSRGFELYPQFEKSLDLEHRGESSASFMSRMISKKIAPIADATNIKALENATTPAGLDFLAGAIGGMLGKDALIAASAVVEYDQKGYVPAMRELPIIKEVLVTYPSTRTRSIQDFYRKADEFERAATTFAHHIKEDPDKAVAYMEANMDKIQYAKLFDSTRSQLAAYRRMIADIKAMDESMITSADRRKLIAEYTEMMLDAAKMANELAK